MHRTQSLFPFLWHNHPVSPEQNHSSLSLRQNHIPCFSQTQSYFPFLLNTIMLPLSPKHNHYSHFSQTQCSFPFLQNTALFNTIKTHQSEKKPTDQQGRSIGSTVTPQHLTRLCPHRKQRHRQKAPSACKSHWTGEQHGVKERVP